MRTQWVRRLGAAMLVLALAACGGGGGGSSGQSGPMVTVDRTSLQFVGFVGNSLPAQTINVTLVNAGSEGPYYGTAISNQPGQLSADFEASSSNSATITFQPLVNTTGTAPGNVTLELCTDSACAHVVWSQSISYTITTFSIANTALSFGGDEGVTSAPQTIAISPVDSAHLLAIASSAPWLVATNNASSIVATASGTGMTAGSYSADITIAIGTQPGAATITVPVSFSIASGIVPPAATSIDLTATTATSALSGVGSISFRAAPNAWTAVSDASWLVLDTPAGAGAGTLAWHVDPTKVVSIPNWSSVIANVHVSATGYSDVTTTITLNKKLPEIYTTQPSTVAAGSTSTLSVTGRGLSQLADGTRVHVGSVGGTSLTAVITSDTNAILYVPALAAGPQQISVTNDAGLATQTAMLAAATPGSLHYATVANAGEKRSALFDPSRNAVYAVNLTQNTLVRYRLVGSTWQVDGKPVASIGDMAMTPDRSTLLVGSGTNLLAIDPDTLATTSTYAASGSLVPGPYFTKGLAVTSDLRVWFGGDQWSSMTYFDILHQSFGTQSLGSLGTNGMLYSPNFYAPWAGSQMIVANMVLDPPLPNEVYDATRQSISSPSGEPTIYNGVSLSGDGSLALVDDLSLYRTVDWSLVGTAQVPATAIGLGTVLSTDGKRIYEPITANNNTLVVDHINVYDTSNVTPGSSSFAVVGQIAVTDQALDCGIQPAYGCGIRGTLFLSPLGDTLFWVGNQRLVVIPIPSAMSGIQSAHAGIAKAHLRAH